MLSKINVFGFSVLALASVSTAFDFTIYGGVNGCEAKDDTTYRIISQDVPTGSSLCFTFGQNMPGTDCAQYNNGGANGHTGCSGNLIPQSVIPRPDDGGFCYVYSGESCSGDSVRLDELQCLDASAVTPAKTIKSFKCFGKQAPIGTPLPTSHASSSTVKPKRAVATSAFRA